MNSPEFTSEVCAEKKEKKRKNKNTARNPAEQQTKEFLLDNQDLSKVPLKQGRGTS